MGKSLDNMLRCWLNFPTHHSGINNMDIRYFEVNARMHCVDVAMGIDTSVLFIGKV
jgi:hypothetical protein